MKYSIIKIIFSILISNIFITNFSIAQNINDTLDETMEGTEGTPIEAPGNTSNDPRYDIKNFLIEDIASNIIIPLTVIVAIVYSIIGFYNLMYSENEEEQSKSIYKIVRGVIGIVLMVSAEFITTTLVGSGGGSLETDGLKLASSLYNEIVYPFLQMAVYIAAGGLFIMLLIQSFRFLFNPSEDIKKYAKTIIKRNTIGILVIISAEQIVELVVGSQSQFNQENPSDIGEIGGGILSTRNREFLINIINRGFGLVAFIILIIVLYQTFLLTTKPEDTEVADKMKKNFIYIFVGLIILAGGYLITNFLIIR